MKVRGPMRRYHGIAQAGYVDPHLLDELAVPRGARRQLLVEEARDALEGCLERCVIAVEIHR